MTDKPKSVVDWLRRYSDIIHRKKISELNDFKNMDDVLLVERIRHLSHSVDLLIKFEWRENKGKDIAEKLVKFLKEFEKRQLKDNNILNWSKNILKKYEIWYSEKKLYVQKTEITKDADFWKLIFNRRSVRKWINKEIPDETIKKLINAAIWAPSSCNRQAWKFTIVPKEKRKLLQHRLLDIAPVVILISVDERPYFFHEKYAQALDVGFAAQNILLAGAALGLGCCPIYFAYPYVQKLRGELGIEKYRKIYLAIAIGYPDENPEAPARPAINNL